jgi:hypothetical protein
MAAAMAAIIGVSYAELASVFPRAGADYEYTRQALGLRPVFVVGWLNVIGNLLAAVVLEATRDKWRSGEGHVVSEWGSHGLACSLCAVRC